jgi:hypothetical protein
MLDKGSYRRCGRAIAVYVKKLTGEEVVACLAQDSARAKSGYQNVWLSRNKDREDLVRLSNGEFWFRME